MRTVAMIPARMGSGRLPGKVMTSLQGKPLLGHLLDRVGHCKNLDEVVVATPDTVQNDCIQDYCESRSVAVFRGSEDDVLDRLLQGLLWSKADAGVLIFGDGPLIDPQIISQAVNVFHANSRYDFVGNDLTTTWPSGMEVEVFKVGALADAAQRCHDPQIREHGTLFIRQNPKIYQLYNLEAPTEVSRSDLSFEVDVMEDLQVVEVLLRQFSGGTDGSLEELIRFMDENPQLTAGTQKIERRWKKYRSK